MTYELKLAARFATQWLALWAVIWLAGVLLTGCAGRMPCTDDGGQMTEECDPRPYASPPDDCMVWTDGCNTCRRIGSGDSWGCTTLGCSEYSHARCLDGLEADREP